MTTHQKLKSEFPNIAITTEWEVDPYYEWDGEGPDPQDEGYLPHNVTVTASRIEAGELIQRHAYLGGCYSQPGDFCPNIDGYFEQLAREAIEALAGSTIKTLPAPFEAWKFDTSTGCLLHPGEYFTSWFRKEDGKWCVQEWADCPDSWPIGIVAAINALG